MADNKSLSAAKKAKCDEFYTQIDDIMKEMCHYRDHFIGKVVFCNCDDPTWSNFWRYFHMNFTDLKLKKLIATHYEPDESVHSYMMEYEGGNDLDTEAGIRTELDGNGDFRSEECKKLMAASDIIVTNPPFSLFREFVSQLVSFEKHFIIIGNQNAITYKEIFPMIMKNQLWLGESIHSGDRKFTVPDSYPLKAAICGTDVDGKKFIRVKGIRWFTNLDIPRRHEKFFDEESVHPTYNGNEEKYPKYDSFNAININKTKEIPEDYFGIMGVPITFLDKYNPEEFEIVGVFNHGKDGPWDLAKANINGVEKFKRIAIQRKTA